MAKLQAPTRRGALDAAVIAKSMKTIPAHACKRGPGPLVEYSKMHSLKVAPKWSECKPFVPFSSEIVSKSQGRNIHVKSMKAGVKQFLPDDASKKDIETTAYSFTAMLAQMIYQKQKDDRKPIPTEHVSNFSALFDKLVDGDGDDDESEVEEIPLPAPHVDVVAISDDDDELGVLSSSDPVVQALLNPEPERRLRISQKKKDDQVDVTKDLS